MTPKSDSDNKSENYLDIIIRVCRGQYIYKTSLRQPAAITFTGTG